MTILGIELNDAAVFAVDGRGEPVSSPGYAVARDGEILVGFDAWKQARLYPRQTTNRFWHDLSDQPLEIFAGGRISSADLAHAQLQHLCGEFAGDLEAVVFAVPAHWSGDQLGLLLGMAQDLAIPVKGLVDSAVAATRREYRGGELLHLDASLHELTITRIVQSGVCSLGKRLAVDRVSIVGLERACTEFIARRFVQSTRFDPLHDGRSEQYLYDNLYSWLRRLQREKDISLTIEFGGNKFSATVHRAELANRIIEYIEPALQVIRNLLAVGSPTGLQVSSRLADFPGLIDALAQLPQVSVFVLEPAAAASGALSRCKHLISSDEGVGLTAELPWDQPAVDLQASSGDSVESASALERRPTHVLFDGYAYRLEHRTFSIGLELSPGEFGVALAGGPQGVSRRHCTIRVDTHGVEVADHSRYGTRLNGHMIEGAAILQSGDVLSLGNPPIEFHLITEVAAGRGNRLTSDGA